MFDLLMAETKDALTPESFKTKHLDKREKSEHTLVSESLAAEQTLSFS